MQITVSMTSHFIKLVLVSFVLACPITYYLISMWLESFSYRIEIDGGVSLDNAAEIVRAGAEILVAGNAVFGKGDVKDNVKNLLKAANEAMLLKA